MLISEQVDSLPFLQLCVKLSDN